MRTGFTELKDEQDEFEDDLIYPVHLNKQRPNFNMHYSESL
jgi:hypothetical protein